ncbi:hypothetical protein SSS_10041, partial [Sarcoptes scabiei]
SQFGSASKRTSIGSTVSFCFVSFRFSSFPSFFFSKRRIKNQKTFCLQDFDEKKKFSKRKFYENSSMMILLIENCLRFHLQLLLHFFSCSCLFLFLFFFFFDCFCPNFFFLLMD